MASFTRTHGNAQQVFHIDTDDGSLSGALATSGPVNVTGPKLDFFKLLINDGSAVDLQSEVGTGLAVEAIIRDIQQIAGVYTYQVEDDTSGQISVAVYPTGAYSASSLQTQIRLLTAAGSNSVDCSSSTVADAGFKLA